MTETERERWLVGRAMRWILKRGVAEVRRIAERDSTVKEKPELEGLVRYAWALVVVDDSLETVDEFGFMKVQ